MNLVILVTGLPRNLDNFFKCLDNYQELRHKKIISRIVFSSWRTRVSGDIEEKLKLKGIEVLLNEEPSNLGLGSVWAQMHALKFGLEVCDENDFVFKTRTDARVSPALLEFLYNFYDNEHPINTDVFKYRVWTPCFEVTKPFYFAEEVFCGHRDDLHNLINADSTYDRLYGKDNIGGETHIRRFMPPFVNYYKKLEIYKNKLEGGNYLGGWSNLSLRLKEEEYIEYLAIYYFVIKNFFFVKEVPHSLFWKQLYCSGATSSFDYGSFSKNFRNVKDSGGRFMHWCHDGKWIEDIIGNKFFDDAHASRVREKMIDLGRQ